MIYVMGKALSFMMIILAGVIARQRHLLPAAAKDVMRKIVINLTLPAAIIVNFSKVNEINGVMLLIVLLGIISNIIPLIVGKIAARRKNKGDQALYMLCIPSYNIGAFGLPYIQSFLPDTGSAAACLFDVGNSIMCTEGTYAIVAESTSETITDGKEKWKAIFERLITSVPFMTYVIMFILKGFKIQLPEFVLLLVKPVSDANAFAAMLMIGLLFQIRFKKEYLKDVFYIIGIRFFLSCVYALTAYYLLPFSLIIRQTLVLSVFSPIAAVSPAYTGLCNGDEGKASCTSSISIIVSIVAMTVLLGVLGLSV